MTPRFSFYVLIYSIVIAKLRLQSRSRTQVIKIVFRLVYRVNANES